MMSTSRAAALLLVVLIAGLAGCASGGGDAKVSLPDLTLAEAREIQNTQLQEFIDLIPADQVTDVWGPIPAMAAMSCDVGLGGEKLWGHKDTGSYQLPGGSDVTLLGSFDVPAFFAEVQARQTRLGWATKVSSDGSDLDLYAPDGFDYSMTLSENGRSKRILLFSFSPCFVPEKHLLVGEKY